MVHDAMQLNLSKKLLKYLNMKTLCLILIIISGSHSFAQTDTAAARLNNYRNRVYEVVNKCSMQDEQVSKAIKAKNPDQIETARMALLQCAAEGIKKLDLMQSFNGDASLKYTAREAVKFYKRLAEYDLPQVRDFFIMEEKFLTTKKDFKNKRAKKMPEGEIYVYNKEIKKYNEAVIRHTQLNNFIAANRKLTLYNWNASLKIFMDTHRSRK